MSMKDRIIALCFEHGPLTFVELQRLLPDFKGQNEYLTSTEFGDVIYWDGMSEECCKAIKELRSTHQIEFDPVSPLAYVVQGAFPKLPIMTEVPTKPFDGPIWLPVTMRIKKH